MNLKKNMNFDIFVINQIYSLIILLLAFFFFFTLADFQNIFSYNLYLN